MQQGGWVTMVDRVKDMIKCGGENISSIEVEEIIRAHPSISDVALIGVPDNEWGEVPMAIVELRTDSTVTEIELIEYCRNHLAHFKVPKSVRFVKSFERTVTGKISKNKLREEYWHGYERRIH